MISIIMVISTNITTQTQLQQSTQNIILKNSIALSENFSQIETFSGIFDGNNFALSGYNSTISFIYQCSSCSFVNITFTQFNISGQNASSIISFGRNITFQNITVSYSTFISSSQAATLIAHSSSNLKINNATILQCIVMGLQEGALFSIAIFQPIVNNSYINVQMTAGGIAYQAVFLTIINSQFIITTSLTTQTSSILTQHLGLQIVINNSVFSVTCPQCSNQILSQANWQVYLNNSYFNISSQISFSFEIYSNQMYNTFVNAYNASQVNTNNINTNSCSYIYIQQSAICANQGQCNYFTTTNQIVSYINQQNCSTYQQVANNSILFPVNLSLSSDFCVTFECKCQINTGLRCQHCPYYLYSNNTCSQQCPLSICHGNCSIYVNQSLICNACSAGYTLINGSCIVNECGTSCNGNGICNNYINNSIKCTCNTGFSSTDNCLTCLFGYQLVNGSCIPLVNNANGECFNINNNITCTQCDNGYVISQNTCVIPLQIPVIILISVCGFILLILVVIIILTSVACHKNRKPKFLNYNPEEVKEAKQHQGKGKNITFKDMMTITAASIVQEESQ